MDYERRKHNTPISTVIKRYLDKKGGKIVESRKDIEWRFNGLDWRYQKQILLAFLESGKSDRAWAYKKLFVYWDDCFIPVLQELWERYNEETLTWLIIRYFPIDFLKNNYDRLNEGRNYYYLCSRLFDTEGFVVDKSRLNECDLIRIRHLLGETVTLGEVKDLFFLLVYKYCKGIYKFRAWRTVETINNTSVLYILDQPLITKMLQEIDYLGTKGFGLSMQLRDWIWTVTKKFLDRHEDVADTFWGEEEEPIMRNMQKAFCYEQINPEYTRVWDSYDGNNQQQFLDYLEKRHKEPFRTANAIGYHLSKPSAQELFKGFELEVVQPQPSYDDEY